MNWKTILILILLLMVVIFTVQNHHVVEIQFLFWSLKASRAIVIFIALVIGVLIGWLTSKMKKRSHNKGAP